MSHGAGASPRTLLWLSLLGLVGCALVAVLHPVEHYDPGRGLEQAGRHVQVTLEVTSMRTGETWARGEALPLAPDGQAFPLRVEWMWFRPPDPVPQVGDRVQGRALVSHEAGGSGLVLDGPRAAFVTPGPLPVPVHWSDLLAHPEPLAGRLLQVNGEVDGDVVRSPDGRSSCPVAGPVPPAGASVWLVRLERDRDEPGWSCRLEGPA